MEIRGAQRHIAEWKRAIFPPCEQTPQVEHERAMQENRELYVEIQQADGSPESNRKIAEEAVDVIIGHLGIIEMTGHDAQELLVNKLYEITTCKYPVDAVQGLMAQGLTIHEAMAERKQNYEQRYIS